MSHISSCSKQKFRLIDQQSPVKELVLMLLCTVSGGDDLRRQEKRRQYDQRVRDVEHARFTPLFMSATGGMGKAAITFYRRLVSMISEKRNTEYS